MPSITIFGGISEIGGNKILIKDKDAKIMLDFGMSFSQHGKFFEEYLKPRASNGFGDLLELNLLPKLEGVYREDLLKISNLEVHKEPLIDGILLSHIHYDHSSYISFLDERIPIYCSEITKVIAKALIESSKRSLETEVYNFKRRPIIRGEKEKPIERNFITVSKNFKIGDLEIKPIEVEHSVLGAMSYLIYTSNGTILYTGDFRKGNLSEKMVEICKEEDIDLMLCEGTNIEKNEKNLEKDVKENSNNIISKTKGLVVVDFAYKDTTRFNTFYEIAKDNDRKIAIAFKDAYLYKALKNIGIKIPDIKDENILLYKERKYTGSYVEKDYETWEREFLNYDNIIKANEINQEKTMICLSFYDINELIDLKPREGSIYIHSASEAHNEEQVIDEQRLNNWLEHFKLKKYHFHASGHCCRDDIKEVIIQISPKKLIPIHTEHADKVKELVEKEIKEVVLTEKEKEYYLK